MDPIEPKFANGRATIVYVRLSDSAPDSVETMTFPNRQTFLKHMEQTEAAERFTRDHFRKDALAQIEANKGSDRVAATTLDKLSEQQWLTNLSTLVTDTTQWQDLKAEHLRYLIPSGAPPLDVTSAELEAYQKEAKGFVNLVPSLWLKAQLPKVFVTPVHIQKIVAAVQDRAEKTAVDALWTNAVGYYNGCVKTLAECLLYRMLMQQQKQKQQVSKTPEGKSRKKP